MDTMRTHGMRIVGVLLVVGMSSSAWAPLKKGNAGEAKPKTVAEQLATFTVPDGFEIELVASEAQGVVKPISLAFDDAGRLWTQTARDYPRDKDVTIWEKGGNDQILVFDTPTNRAVQTPRVFADKLAMPTGLLPYKNGVYVAHGTQMLFLSDTDGDNQADKRDVLLKGFGVQDTHTGIHQLELGPGGWMYFSQGVLAKGTVTDAEGVQTPFNRSIFARVRMDGTQLQVLGRGANNAWAWAVDRVGRAFTHEANDFGYGQIFWERDATYPSFIKTVRYPDSMMHPPTAQGLNLGGTGFSGIAVSEGGANSFPEDWQGGNFVANPITGTINTVSYEYDGKGVMRFKKEADLVQCSDPMFRPIYVLFGPDGCLYIADWYNGIISHNEVPRDHPHRNKTHGRIWRVRHVGQKPITQPAPAVADSAVLLEMLQSDNGWVQRAAWRQIVARDEKGLVPELKTLAVSERADVAVHAIWCLESLDGFDTGVWTRALASKDQHVRHEAVRSLSSFQISLDQAVELTKGLQKDPSYRVRNEVVRFFRDRHDELADPHREHVASFGIAKDKLPKDTVKGWKGTYLAMGGAYEGAFLNLLVDKALNGEPVEQVVDLARWSKVIETVKKTPAAKAAEADRIAKLTAFVTANPKGDLAKGEQHFKSLCSHCHAIDPIGSGFAPPLSGGAARSIEGTITAIVSPGAAIEEVFRAYRVEQKDGAVLEGFLSDLGAKQLTLTFMGGVEQKIPLSKIKKAGYVSGKSVMPAGFGAGLGDVGIRDLVTFLRQTPAADLPVVRVEFESLDGPREDAARRAQIQDPGAGGIFDHAVLSGKKHVFMPFRQAGESVTYRIPATGSGARSLTIGLSTSLDFGMIDVLVNGKLAKSAVDTYTPKLAVLDVALGSHRPISGAYDIGIRVAAANKRGKNSRTYAAADYIDLGGAVAMETRLVEFESLGKPHVDADGIARPQRPGGRFNPKTLSGESHIFLPFGKVGQSVSYKIPVEGTDPQPLTVGVTTCLDFGVVDILVNGRVVKKHVDLYTSDLAVKKVALGAHKPQGGAFVVGVRLAAVNTKGQGKRTYAGLDFVQVNGEAPVDIAAPIAISAKLPPIPADARRQVLFVAGHDTHGWGQHDHNAGVDLLSHSLKEAMNGEVEVRILRNKWPTPEDFAWAHTCVVYSDGWGRSLLKGEDRLDEVEAFMSSGRGIIRIHWATGSDPKDRIRHRELFGGNMENGFSVHSTDWRQSFKLAEHPISSGVKPFQLFDECYFHMHWHSDGKEGIADLLTAIPEKGFRTGASSAVANASIARGDNQTVGWSFARPAGGRAFSYTGGHYHFNWANDNLRKFVLNAILWTANGEIPEVGLESERPSAKYMLDLLETHKAGGKKNPGWTPEVLSGYLELINRPNTSFHWRPYERRPLPALPAK